MEKIKINLDILLPDIHDEKDACVLRIITALENRKGIDKVHIVPGNGNLKSQLCFHYDPNLVTVEQVRKIAQQAGAAITEQYGHLLLEVEGIRHQRQTSLAEAALRNLPGILSISVSGGGMVQIEYDMQVVRQEEIFSLLKKEGLKVISQIPSKPHNHDNHEHDHKHAHGEGEIHDHHHGGIFGKNSELVYSILCGVLLGIGWGLSHIASVPAIAPLILYICAYFFGGYYTAREAVQTITRGGFEIDFLMLVAAIGAAILGNWAEGALLLFLFSMGHALEHYAMAKAQKSIKALTELAPKTALLKTGQGTKEIPVDELNTGDVLVVRPNTKIPADGIVVAGTGSVNQAPITGESIPVDKTAVDDPGIDLSSDQIDAKFRVFAGTINGNTVLEIKVTRTSADSTLARLVKMVSEAQTQKSPTQQFTNRIEKYFVPAVLVLVTLLCFSFLVIDEPFSKSFYRAMSVLVAASPCALAISTPSAVLSGVARAARGGVLIKGGKPLEDLGTLDAVAFDKTGTLTEGKPKLTEVVALNNTREHELLGVAIAVESLSDHPLAKAIVSGGKEKLGNGNIPVASDLEAVLGKGVKAKLGPDTVYAGNLALFEKLEAVQPDAALVTKVQQLEEAGNTTMLFRKNDQYIGIIAVMDAPRSEAKEALEQLRKIGIRKMIMLTGDNQKVADAVAKQVGVTEVRGGMLPEQKVEAISELARREGRVAMVGDGVNDAPAMAKSTVGIAMGAAGSDVALETADIALMGDQLVLLPFAIGLSRKAKAIIRQNLFMSLGVVAILIPLTILNIASIGPAVIAHEGSTLLVVFNALRLLAYKKA